MKKTKCALGLVAFATSVMALSGCGRATASKDGVIMTYTDANGNRTSYTAEDLLKNYQSYSSSLSSEFDKIYEVLVRHYYDQAAKAEGKTGTVLLTTIEKRLDNVVFRLGLAATRREARQLVNHAHFTVNGQKVNIPSYLVKVGDVVKVSEKSRSSARFKAIAEGETKSIAAPKWLEKDADLLGGKVVAAPEREDIDFPVEEHLIVELYSK